MIDRAMFVIVSLGYGIFYSFHSEEITFRRYNLTSIDRLNHSTARAKLGRAKNVLQKKVLQNDLQFWLFAKKIKMLCQISHPIWQNESEVAFWSIRVIIRY